MRIAILGAALAVVLVSPAAAADFTISVTDQEALEAVAWARQQYNDQPPRAIRPKELPAFDGDSDFLALRFNQQLAAWKEAKRKADLDAAIAAALAGDRGPALQLLNKVAPER